MSHHQNIFHVGLGAETFKVGDMVIWCGDPVVVIGIDKSKDCIYVKLANGRKKNNQKYQYFCICRY